jgi:hypothetical protein
VTRREDKWRLGKKMNGAMAAAGRRRIDVSMVAFVSTSGIASRLKLVFHGPHRMRPNDMHIFLFFLLLKMKIFKFDEFLILKKIFRFKKMFGYENVRSLFSWKS